MTVSPTDVPTRVRDYATPPQNARHPHRTDVGDADPVTGDGDAGKSRLETDPVAREAPAGIQPDGSDFWAHGGNGWQMAVFVTGGSGFIGRHLVRTPVERGDTVRALARSDEAEATVRDAGAEPVRGDLAAVDAMADGMAGCSVAFHAAAKADEWGPRDAFERVNVEGTQHVVDAARRASVDRIVHVSTEAVLADGRPHREVDETEPTPESPVGLYAETKARAERLVLAADDDDLTTVAVRPPTVWGPDDTSVGAKFAAAVESGRFAWISGGRYPVSTGHVENVVEGLLLAAETPDVGGEVFFVTDGDPIEFRTFLTELMATRGLTPGGRSIPRPVAKAMAIGFERLWRRLGRDDPPPISKTYVYVFGFPMTIDDSKARAALGYDPPIERETGLEALRENRSNG